MSNSGKIPLLTFSFLDYFSTLELNDKFLVEIGSGDSTLYWENKFKKVISYECDIDYFNYISNTIKKESTVINLFDENVFDDSKFLKNIQSCDYVIIDNNPNFISRLEFAKFVFQNAKENCFIILDNGTWNLEAYTYLIDNFFVKDFPGLNKENEITVTSLFHLRRTPEYFRYTKLPVIKMIRK